MIELAASVVVVAVGAFFVALGAASLLAPSSVRKFFLGFAGSPMKHYAELAVRFVVGGAFVLHAPQMLLSRGFHVLGWVVLATTAGLLLVPWDWHRRFAGRAVPDALRFLPLLGVSAVALGGLVLLAVFRGSAA